jgi:hypothetical protein
VAVPGFQIHLIQLLHTRRTKIREKKAPHIDYREPSPRPKVKQVIVFVT